MKNSGYYLLDIVPNITVTTAALDLVATYSKINGQTVTLEVLSGNVWVKPGTTTVTTLNGNKLEGKVSIDINVSNGLQVISDSSAIIQIWILG